MRESSRATYTLERWADSDVGCGEWVCVGQYRGMEQAQPVAEDYRDRGELVRLTREGVVVVRQY